MAGPAGNGSANGSLPESWAGDSTRGISRMASGFPPVASRIFSATGAATSEAPERASSRLHES